MQKCTLLSWGLRLPRATVMCDCYSKVQGYAGSDPLYRDNTSVQVKASQGLHKAKHMLPDWAAPDADVTGYSSATLPVPHKLAY